MKCIKIGIRRNLIYPMLTIVFIFLRQITSIAIDVIFDFNNSLIITFIMFLSEFIFGLILYFYHINLVSQNENLQFKIKKLLKFPNPKTSNPDSHFKIYLLLFFATFFDFVGFLIETFFLPRFIKNSKTLKVRLYGLEIIISAILCYFLLRLKIYRHQIFSLIIVFICLIIIMIFDYYFNNLNKGDDEDSYEDILSLFSIDNVFVSFIEVTEKYLLEYDYINPFQIIMFEGFFGVILTSIISLFNITNEKVNYYEINNYFLLIFFLLLYFVFSGGRNIYRILTNKLYSPMARTLTDYILNPIFITYYYLFGEEFKSGIEEKQSSFYFAINLFMSIITVFCSCIYNELFVLYCFNLQYDTHFEISKRAKKIEKNEELLPMEQDISFSGDYVFHFPKKQKKYKINDSF